MSMVIQDLATTRKEALLSLLKLFSTERFTLGQLHASFIISDPEPQYAEELQLAAPYLVKPTHLKTLFVVRYTGNEHRSVAFAMSDGYISVGAHEAPGQALFACKNIFVYRPEHIGHAINATIGFLTSKAPFDPHAAMIGRNGIANLPDTGYTANGAGIALTPNL